MYIFVCTQEDENENVVQGEGFEWQFKESHF